MIVGSIVLDERGDRRDVAGVHSWHAGSAAHGGRLVVQVQHPEGRSTGGASEMKKLQRTPNV